MSGPSGCCIKDEAKRLQGSNGLNKMIFVDCQPPVREGNFISIYHFAQQHYVQKPGGPTLEDESWDHLLFEELMSSQQVNEAERPAWPWSSPWAKMLEEESKARRSKEPTLLSETVDAECIPPVLQTGMVVAVDSEVFEVEEKIGKGGFGSVFRCCTNMQGAVEADNFAMKVRWALVQSGMLRPRIGVPELSPTQSSKRSVDT